MNTSHEIIQSHQNTNYNSLHNDNHIIVSVVMPIYNEERFIQNCINSLLNQDYPKENMEWIFVDGGSSDNTKVILKEFRKGFPNLIKLCDNPKKAVPFAMNIGIKNSSGKYIIRLDAHAEYTREYISKCVYYLDNTDADNVGGLIETKSNGLIGRTIALMLSSRFGVGNSKFRTNGKSGYVDTVPFGAFRKEVFEKYGLYDERLIRNEDNELNHRIRKNGGKIYLADDIHLTYYSRESIKGILKMAFDNGRWNLITSKLTPGSMVLRHFIPFIFLLSLVMLPFLHFIQPLFGWILFVEILLYLILDVSVSIQLSKGNIMSTFLLIIIFPLFHITYGIGSLFGVMAANKRYAD